MASYNFVCQNGHVTEKFFKSINSPDSIVCSDVSCGEVAEKSIIGGTATLPSNTPLAKFQKYAFGEHNYATHKDRESWVNNNSQQEW